MKEVRGLYAITPDTPDTLRLVEMVRSALEGGAALVQYRNKTSARALKRDQAVALRVLCEEFSRPFIVNDDPALAVEIGAGGAHIGVEDGAIREARKLLGADRILGVSCYNNIGRALRAKAQGADYVAFGSFFQTATKPGAVTAPMDLLREAKNRLRLPLVAIGGIDLNNAPQLVAAGADAVAVVSALFSAPDVRRAAEKFAGMFS